MTAHQAHEPQVTVEIGARIHALMWRKRITQTQLAVAVGISQGQLSRKLRGTSPMTVAELYAIAGGLGVEVASLLAEQHQADPVGVTGSASSSLPRLDSNQQPSGYRSRPARRRHLVAVPA